MKNKAVFVLAFALMLTGCGSKESSKNSTKLNVTVVKIKEETIPITRKYIGLTQSIASVDIRARVEGFLIQKNFTEGKLVKKGQLIYVIDPQPSQVQLNLAQGNLAQSIASKDYQEVEFLRNKQLVAKGDVAKSTFDSVAAQYQEAMAQVEIQNANVQQAQINLGYCSMYSPIDGIIGKKYVDVGNLVGAGENTLLATVVQLNPIYVLFNPSVEDFGEFLQYRSNMPFPVEVTLPHDGNIKFKGKVDLINNEADVSTSTILMRAVLENPDELLIPNIYVNVNLYLSNKDKTLLVPIKAVMESQGQRTVYVVDSNNKIDSKLITVSGQYGEQYIVTSGLKAGETVVVGGLQKLQPGIEVVTTVEKS